MAVIIGTVVGKIGFLPFQQGIPNAKIDIPDLRRVISTDSSGNFSIRVPDDCNITVTAEGYRSKGVKVEGGILKDDHGNPISNNRIELAAGRGVSKKLIKVGTFQFFSLNFNNLLFAVVITILAFIFVSPKMPGILSLIAPLGAGLLVFLSSRGKGMLPTVGYAVLFGGAWFLLLWIITAAGAGTLTNIETWLKPIDWFHWLGVPQDYLEAFKQGIRNIFGSLTPTPQTPQAEKIGGYQALEVKFGSKYTEYSIPTLYADGPIDASYSIPVTISNPNPIDSDLTVRDFSLHSLNLKETATEVDMRTTKSGLVGKIMCGFSDACKLGNLCNIEPQREEQIILTFEHDAPCTTLPNSIHLVDVYNKEECEKKYDCKDTPFISTKGEWKTRGIEGEGCYCKKKREKNNFTELCDELRFGDKVAIEFASKFTFSAVGSSEFRILEKEENIKIAPQPKIKTSSGPVDITIYFIPDYISNETPRDAVKMIVNVANKGGGRADITEVKPLETTSPVSVDFGDCVNRIKKITSVNDGEERPAICDVKFPQGTAIPGPYVTIPISIDIKYTYEKIESVAIPITRYEFNPSDPLQEGFAGSTGYCPKS